MKLRALFIVALIICLSITQITPVFAEQARILPFVNYFEQNNTFLNPGEGSTYKLSRDDVFDIVIIDYPNNEMFRNIRIGIDGFVNLPLVGAIMLDGLTVNEAQIILTERLSEYLRNVNLSIIIRQYGARQVYVMGEVRREGVQELRPTAMNIFAAISSAGGITRRGRPKHIALVRIVDDEIIMREINLDAFIRKQDINQIFALQDGDMIFVPKSNKVLLNEDILPILQTYRLIDLITR